MLIILRIQSDFFLVSAFVVCSLCLYSTSYTKQASNKQELLHIAKNTSYQIATQYQKSSTLMSLAHFSKVCIPPCIFSMVCIKFVAEICIQAKPHTVYKIMGILRSMRH